MTTSGARPWSRWRRRWVADRTFSPVPLDSRNAALHTRDMNTITRTEQAGTVTYALVIDGEVASHLDIDAATRKVTNVETFAGFERQGFARALWEHATAEAECFHALPHHRTDEGDAFAEAMGGETIDEADDYIAECCICTGETY